MTVLNVSAAQIDKVIQSVSDTTPGNIPVADNTGGVEDSNISQDPTGEIRAATEIKAEDGLDTVPGTLTLGDALDIEGSGGQQTNFSRVTGRRYQMPYQKFDKTGTEKTFQVDMETEIINNPRQAVFDTTMVSPLIFNYLSPRNEIVNKVYLRTAGSVTNFRYQVKSLDTGEIIDSYPDKFKYSKDEGVDIVGAGIYEVDLYFVESSTPNRFLDAQTIEVTMKWDIGDFLGKAAPPVPYFAYDYQPFEFVDMLSDADVLDEDNMVSDSDAHVATQQSIKKYVDDMVTSSIILKGEYDASANTPNLDVPPTAAMSGYLYVVTVAGTFFSVPLTIGDAIISKIDDPQVEADWIIMCRDLDASTVKILYESNPNTEVFETLEKAKLGLQSGTNTGDQDLSSLATIAQVNNTTGYANYLDSSTAGSPRNYASNSELPLINDKSIPDGSRYPDSITSYWDNVGYKFTPDQADGNYAFSVNFSVDAVTRDKRLVVKFISYDAGGPGVDVLVQKRLVRLQKDDGVITPISLSFTTGITSAIMANGVSVTLEFQDTAAEVYDITCGLAKVGAGII